MRAAVTVTVPPGMASRLPERAYYDTETVYLFRGGSYGLFDFNRPREKDVIFQMNMLVQVGFHLLKRLV